MRRYVLRSMIKDRDFAELDYDYNRFFLKSSAIRRWNSYEQLHRRLDLHSAGLTKLVVVDTKTDEIVYPPT